MKTGSTEERYWAALALAGLSQSGGNAILRLLKTMDPEQILAAGEEQLVAEHMNAAAAGRFIAARHRSNPEVLQSDLDRAELRFVPYGAPDYPQELTNLSHPPAGLFVKGGAKELETLLRVPRITIVGTRRATPYGKRAAGDYAAAFAARGILVVSGLALGIDGRAHEAALGVGGQTAAVLGCGVDVVYPPRHRGLYNLLADKGLILSELPPGTPPSRWTFPHRNRLLAALGDAVLVVEGGATSGALQTADQATTLGRQVFAVPGSIYSDGHRGCHLLLRDGALLAMEPEKTVEEFLLETRIERGGRRPLERQDEVARRGVGQDPFRDLVAAGRDSILEAIGERPSSIDSLALRTGMSARLLAVALAELELAGLAARAGPGLYIRAP